MTKLKNMFEERTRHLARFMTTECVHGSPEYYLNCSAKADIPPTNQN